LNVAVDQYTTQSWRRMPAPAAEKCMVEECVVEECVEVLVSGRGGRCWREREREREGEGEREGERIRERERECVCTCKSVWAMRLDS
jgi:hypothetical protein